MDSTDIGELIRRAREAQRMTLEEMAERVEMTPGALSHIERGRRLPTPANAVRIAEALGLLSDDVLEALDEAHRQRRMSSLSGHPLQSKPSATKRSHRGPEAKPRAYEIRDVEALFAPPETLHRASQVAPASDSRSNREMARWSDDTSARIEALDELADNAADAIRTLRGALGDEDEKVRREARRLLRELDVRLPEE